MKGRWLFVTLMSIKSEMRLFTVIVYSVFDNTVVVDSTNFNNFPFTRDLK